MASKRITLDKTFKQLNNGGEIDEATFLLQIKTLQGKIIIGTSGDDTPPAEKDCFEYGKDYGYGGDENVFAKAKYPFEIDCIIDKV